MRSSSFSLFFFTILLIAMKPSYGALPSSPNEAGKTLVVAVIDTGMDIDHRDLRQSIWRNPGESGLDENGLFKSKNGRDDDNNGYIDDSTGWNFADDNKSIDDESGHGTHVAGIISRTLRAKSETIRFQLMPLKYVSPATSAADSIRTFVAALRYAIAKNADIINISGGGYSFNVEEYSLLQEAARKNIRVVAAAGNKTPHSEDRLFYPAAYDLPNIVSVVATDKKGDILPTSNLNPGKKNVFSLGDHVWSTMPRDSFGYKTGSSQAAAVISGTVGAEILSPVTMTATNLHNP
jgi:thermitase